MRSMCIALTATVIVLTAALVAAPPAAACTVTASCGSGGTVSCSGSSCLAEDDACPSSDGWVKCDGAIKFCGGCPCPDEGRLCMTDADCRASGYPICDFCFCGLKAPTEDQTELPNGFCQCYLTE